MDSISPNQAIAFLDAVIHDETLAEQCSRTDLVGNHAIAASMGLTYTDDEMRKAIQERSRHLFSPIVVDHLLDRLDGMHRFIRQLEGEDVDMTVLFADLARFTMVIETLSMKDLVRLLNSYFSAMSEIIETHGGFVVAFEGDMILTVFGAPIPYEDHAARACRTAVAMQVRLKDLNAQWQLEEGPALAMRVGLNSNPALIGNMGTATKLDYTIMGAEVNIASRLEEINKIYGSAIIASESTWKAAGPVVEARELDCIRLKQTEPLIIYELLAEKGTLHPDRQAQIQHFEAGLQLYRNRQWEEAVAQFRSALQFEQKDSPSGMYLDRSERYLREPPDELWDGVTDLSEINDLRDDTAELERLRAELASLEDADGLSAVVGTIGLSLKKLAVPFQELELNIINEEEGIMACYGWGGPRGIYQLDQDATLERYNVWQAGDTRWQRLTSAGGQDRWRMDLPFAHGMLTFYRQSIGNLDKHEDLIPEQDLTLLRRFSDVLSIGYARYLERRRIEATRKQQMEIMTRELQVAREMQISLLPEEAPQIEGYDIAGICTPAYEVGGDHYGYHWLDEDHTKLAIVVADVSGKEMQAAMTVMRFSELLYYETQRHQAAAALLTGLNKAMIGRFGRRTFVTACAAVLDTTANTISVANAGHPPAFYVRASGTAEEIYITGLPLGVRKNARYESMAVNLAPGDSVVLYSDGLYEARGEAAEQFGFERMAQTLSGMAGETSQVIAKQLITAVDDYTGGVVAEDDQTVVAVRRI